MNIFKYKKIRWFFAIIIPAIFNCSHVSKDLLIATNGSKINKFRLAADSVEKYSKLASSTTKVKVNRVVP
jgi:hypothetical protein